MSLEKDIATIIESTGNELYDAVIVSENGETIYRVSVISPEVEDGKRKGVSLDTCVELTHLISPLLDVTPPTSGMYRLEVGTPGIERKLSTLRHFELSIGENVALSTLDKEKCRGKLLSVDGNNLTLACEEEERTIDFHTVAKAKTYFE